MKLRSNQNIEILTQTLPTDSDGVTYENESKKMKLDFPRKTNVYTNSWCNNILLTRLVTRNHQNEKKKT